MCRLSCEFRRLNTPKELRQIVLRFSEPKIERTQQFTHRWADS
jgi:hypothetical protein